MTECTFKPSTNEARNKQLIREMLDDNVQENKENEIFLQQQHQLLYQ